MAPDAERWAIVSSIHIGPGLDCDLDRLISTRLLLQAGSGAGKSWALRRLLEQTHGRIQQIVIDHEGEFASLRAKYDYVLAARTGGDTVAHPRTAALLAERLLEIGVSAILDVYELPQDDRIEFVRLFLEALVDAPKRLWHPVLVAIDEAHIYCPENGDAASADAVMALCSRGRKRGFCAVLATQRLAKLSKDAAADLQNKLIGRTTLDVDMSRAGSELGFAKTDRLKLRDLDDGEFYGFGPALSRVVTKVKVGPVKTKHPKAGVLSAVVPPPSKKVRALLPKLSDLPHEAEEREKSMATLKKELATAQRELREARRSQPAPPPPVEKIIKVPILKDSQVKRLERLIPIAKALEHVLTTLISATGRPKAMAPAVTERRPTVPAAAVPAARPARASSDADVKLGKCERGILTVLAQQDGCTAARLTLLSGYRWTGGFQNSLSTLRKLGYIVGDNSGTMMITGAGLEAIGPVEPLPTGQALARYWIWNMKFTKAARVILEALVKHPNGMDINAISKATNYAVSGGFKNALSELRTAGLITGANSDTMRVSEDLL